MSSGRRYRDTGMNSFWGHMAYQAIIPPNHFMRALKQLFDWEDLGAHLILLYEGRGEVGRPPYPPVMIFKMLFLSYLYDLSERDTERFVNENIPARYFLGLALNQPAPDHSSLSTFKRRLIQAGGQSPLEGIFDGLLRQARGHGLRLGQIQLVDSVHTQADVNTEKDKVREKKGQAPRDPDARVVDKGKREVVEPGGKQVKKEITYHGYKTHISMDAKTYLATSMLPAWGNSADNKAFPELFEHDLSLGLPTHTYGGDRAYDDTDIFERIEQQGLHVGIKLRKTRTQKKDPNKQRWIDLLQTPYHRVATSLRSRVEQPFGQAKDKHGFEHCRYLGLARYRIQAFLTFMVVNVKRMVKLLTGITFRAQAKGIRMEVFKPVYASLPWA